jgi:hypothetical protein
LPQPIQETSADEPLALVPLKTAFARLSLSPMAGYRLVHSGQLPIRKIGRRSYVLSSDLEAYLKGLPAKVWPAPTSRAGTVRPVGKVVERVDSADEAG